MTFKAIFLLISAFILSSIYVWNNQKTDNFAGLLIHHGEVGYNVARHNSIKVNQDRIGYISELQQKKGYIIDYADIDQTQFGPPTEYRCINDTVGYGVLLGLLWKLTGSYRYLDVQILQLFMYLFMLIFLYYIALMLFANSIFAYFLCFVHLSFFPLLAQNAQILRDIWVYYATVILVYAFLAALQRKISFLSVVACGIFFALCTHLRPTIVATLLLLSLVMVLIGSWMNRGKDIRTVIAIFWGTSLLFFWVPFMAYNKIAYDRWFVSPSGMWLIEGGIGAFPNPWGYKCDDGWYASFMKEKYGLTVGTAECEDKGRELYWQAFKEQPGIIISSIIRQIPHIVFPQLPWINTLQLPEAYKVPSKNWSDKLRRFVKNPSLAVLVNFICLYWFRFVFMLLGYVGMVFMLVDRRYIAFFLLASVIFSSYNVILSHVEPRYIIPFYWPFSIFVGYALERFLQRIRNGKYSFFLSHQG